MNKNFFDNDSPKLFSFFPGFTELHRFSFTGIKFVWGSFIVANNDPEIMLIKKSFRCTKFIT
jgi:hypothetical protein